MKNKLFFPMILGILVFLGSCQNSETTLFNGKDFNGWKFVLSDSTVMPEEIWSVREGMIHCEGTTNGYMRTTEKYSDYTLTLEWRWTEKEGNSGVLLNMQLPDKVWPNCIECQLQAGSAGDIILIGPGSLQHGDSTVVCDSAYTVIPKLNPSPEKPIGEWNRYTIICTPEKISATVNGVLQNEGTHPSLTEGYICLQSEGAPIEFRNIVLTPNIAK